MQAERRGVKRQFTRAEDEMILGNAEGKVTFADLCAYTQASKKTLLRRALELGKALQLQRHRRRQHAIRPLDGVMCSITVGSDELLKRLFDEHGERRYESGLRKKPTNKTTESRDGEDTSSDDINPEQGVKQDDRA